MPLITRTTAQAEAFAKGPSKLGPSPSAKAVAKVYAETVDAAFVYKFLELGHSGEEARSSEWEVPGLWRVGHYHEPHWKPMAFSAALKALDQKAPDRGFLLAEVALSLVEPCFNPKFTGVVEVGENLAEGGVWQPDAPRRARHFRSPQPRPAAATSSGTALGLPGPPPQGPHLAKLPPPGGGTLLSLQAGPERREGVSTD